MEFVKLPEICNIKTGKRDANHATKDGKYRFYTCSNSYSMCDTYSFEGPCVIVPGNGDIGLVFFYDGQFEAYQRTYVLENIKINPKYLYYHFVYKWRYINSNKQFGSTVKYVRIGNFNNYDVPICSEEEQQNIVNHIEELFSELDKIEETLLKTKGQLKVYKQAVLKEAFEGKLTIKWRKENHIGLEEIKEVIRSAKTKNKSTKIQEEIILPEIPENWQWISINDITNGVGYGTSKKSSPKGEVPVIRMGNIQHGKIDWSDLVYSSDKEEIKKYKLHYNDVLFNRTNSPEHVGKTAVYKGEREAIFAGYLIRINHFECINSDYLAYYLNSFLARQYSNKVKTDGVNQSNINGTKLKSYPFPLCSLQEQDQIVLELETRLSEFNEILKVVEKTLMQTNALKQSILKEAFEGKLV